MLRKTHLISFWEENLSSHSSYRSISLSSTVLLRTLLNTGQIFSKCSDTTKTIFQNEMSQVLFKRGITVGKLLTSTKCHPSTDGLGHAGLSNLRNPEWWYCRLCRMDSIVRSIEARVFVNLIRLFGKSRRASLFSLSVSASILLRSLSTCFAISSIERDITVVSMRM